MTAKFTRSTPVYGVDLAINKKFRYGKYTMRYERPTTSHVTKRALARCIRRMMEEMPLAELTEKALCERAEVNIKSFKWHFRDKHDLIVWIFETEYLDKAYEKDTSVSPDRDEWRANTLFAYLTRYRNYYKNAFSVKGDETLEGLFRRRLLFFVRKRMKNKFAAELLEYRCKYITDAIILAIEERLLSENGIPCENFYVYLCEKISLIVKYFEEKDLTE